MVKIILVLGDLLIFLNFKGFFHVNLVLNLKCLWSRLCVFLSLVHSVRMRWCPPDERVGCAHIAIVRTFFFKKKICQWKSSNIVALLFSWPSFQVPKKKKKAMIILQKHFFSLWFLPIHFIRYLRIISRLFHRKKKSN